MLYVYIKQDIKTRHYGQTHRDPQLYIKEFFCFPAQIPRKMIFTAIFIPFEITINVLWSPIFFRNVPLSIRRVGGRKNQNCP